MRKSGGNDPLTETSPASLGAVIVAAGSSRRMGGIDKLFTSVEGRPLLAWTVQAFQNCEIVKQIVLVVSRQNLAKAQNLVKKSSWPKVKGICTGGERRQDSVANGLKHLSGCDWVAIHDGARPCVNSEIIERGLAEAFKTGAAIAAVPVKDTIKLVSDGAVRETPDRSNLWMVQTPQIFRFDIISTAYANAANDVTDDASLVEAIGLEVRVYTGSYENIKVTTAEDLALVAMLLHRRTGHGQNI